MVNTGFASAHNGTSGSHRTAQSGFCFAQRMGQFLRKAAGQKMIDPVVED